MKFLIFFLSKKGMTLHDYRLSCKLVLYGAGRNCTEICQLAIGK